MIAEERELKKALSHCPFSATPYLADHGMLTFSRLCPRASCLLHLYSFPGLDCSHPWLVPMTLKHKSPVGLSLLSSCSVDRSSYLCSISLWMSFINPNYTYRYLQTCSSSRAPSQKLGPPPASCTSQNPTPPSFSSITKSPSPIELASSISPFSPTSLPQLPTHRLG